MADIKSRRELQLVTASELAPLRSVMDQAYPDRLAEVATCLFIELLDQSKVLKALGKPGLAQLALALTERISTDLGGGSFYMHKGTSYRLTLRDREMCAAFNGRNYHQLAKAYDLTEMRVRQIVDTWQREDYSKRQGTLAID